MKQLFLIRHAKSSWEDSSLSDKERPLNDRGRSQLAPLARTLNRFGALSGHVYASPAVRAQQTLAGALSVDAQPAQVCTEDELYTFDFKRLLRWLQNLDNDQNRITIIGHNPALLELAAFLVPQAPFELPTAGILEIRLSVRDWKKVDKNKGVLETFLTPRDFSYREFRRKNRKASPGVTSLDQNTLPEVLQQLSNQLEQLTPGAILGLDDEFLHQYRIALRRSRAIAEPLAEITGDRQLQEHIRELKRHARATSALRDLHVFLQDIPELCHDNPQLCTTLTDWARLRASKAQRKLAKRLGQKRYQQSLSRWQDYIESKSFHKLAANLRKKDIQAATNRRLKQFNRKTAELLHTAPDEALHQLRKNLKRIRYLLELDARHSKPFRKELRQRQDLYGRFQDLHVQIELTRRFLADHPECDGASLTGKLEREKADTRRQILAMGGLNV
ncbi:CHAD domain-containing protein [Marinobacter nauticus]|uniref:CHAD domain-containing protein n=1 Tax=Marinobacter nauticus TaxID=2743 RepID=UPI003514BA0C